MSTVPFRPDSLEIAKDAETGTFFVLRSMPMGEANKLGPQFAAIEPWKSYPYTGEALADYLGAIEKGSPRLVVLSGEDLAGVLVVRTDWLRGPLIQFLGVLPAYQKRGIGTELLRWTESQAHALEAQNVWITASDLNARAVHFCQRLGFQPVAALDDLVRGGRTEILLRKKL